MARTASDTASPRAVLDRMGIVVLRIRVLTQRDNAHWLVETPDQRLVLRRYAQRRSRANVDYEIRLLEHLDRCGWPVPLPVAPLVEAYGSFWCAFTFMPGRALKPRSPASIQAEQRRRGRLLAALHGDMAGFAVHGQRDGWRRTDEGLVHRTSTEPADQVLARYERSFPEQGRILRAYHERMQERLAALIPHAPPLIVVHGDFTAWNMRYIRGSLSGIFDFEVAHLDLRVADFALSWRGKHHEVIRGYDAVSPLDPVEHELITPIFWAWCLAGVIENLDAGITNTEWSVTHLLRTELEGTAF